MLRTKIGLTAVSCLLVMGTAHGVWDEKVKPSEKPQAAFAAEANERALKKIQGKWKLVKETNSKETKTYDQEAKPEWTFEDKKLMLIRNVEVSKTVVKPDGTPEIVVEMVPVEFSYQCVIRWGKDMNEIDLLDQDKITGRGIYELKNDSLKLCLNLHPDGNRPKEFKVGSEDNSVLCVMKRVKKDDPGESGKTAPK